jgi:hypothetical protein
MTGRAKPSLPRAVPPPRVAMPAPLNLRRTPKDEDRTGRTAGKGQDGPQR